MNAGKTTTLLQSSHNYVEKGMRTLVLKPLMDVREGSKKVRSRIGLEAETFNFDQDDDLYEMAQKNHQYQNLHCILVDEAQFLSRSQVDQLGNVVGWWDRVRPARRDSRAA